jgi:hypothetical protein
MVRLAADLVGIKTMPDRSTAGQMALNHRIKVRILFWHPASKGMAPYTNGSGDGPPFQGWGVSSTLTGATKDRRNGEIGKRDRLKTCWGNP